MAVTKKTASATKSGTKKSAAKPAPTHPSWIDMIKECIVNSDDRQGVSRPQIKKYVEEQYKLEFGNAQNTQLAKAIATGAEKGTFVLPKGPSGKVKLPPKSTKPADTSASKENKPTKPASKSKVPTKPRPTKAPTTTTDKAKSSVTKKSTGGAPKATVKKPAARTSGTETSASKPKPSAAPKKTLAGKKTVPAKKTTAPAKRAVTKKSVTGTSSTKAKSTVAKKPAAKKPAAKAGSSGTKKAANKA